MPNRFTRVPEEPVPSLPGWAARLVPVADLFMVLLISRPPTGTLRTTWVTPATQQLCAVLAVVCAASGAALVATAGSARPAVTLLGAALILFGAGCGSVALVGFAQRHP